MRKEVKLLFEPSKFHLVENSSNFHSSFIPRSHLVLLLPPSIFHLQSYHHFKILSISSKPLLHSSSSPLLHSYFPIFFTSPVSSRISTSSSIHHDLAQNHQNNFIFTGYENQALFDLFLLVKKSCLASGFSVFSFCPSVSFIHSSLFDLSFITSLKVGTKQSNALHSICVS